MQCLQRLSEILHPQGDLHKVRYKFPMELQLWLSVPARRWRWYIAGLAMLESLEALLRARV